MDVEFDPAKRARTLRERGLDLARAGAIFEGFTLTFEDDREDYGEERYVTFGCMGRQVVACVWTMRGDNRRIISLRKAEKDEREIYHGCRP